MTREKKKLTYQELEEHAIYWGTDRMEEVRQIAERIYHDQSIIDEEKEFIYSGLAQQLSDLLDLMSPLRHDEEHLILWVNEFVDEYAKFDKYSSEG